MDSIVLIVVLCIVALINGGLLWYILFGGRRKTEDAEGMLVLQNQVHELARSLDARLAENSERVHETVRQQFSESQKLIQNTNAQMIKHLTDVTQGVTEVREAGKQVFGIAEQLQNLEKVLTHQKQRGSLGEAGLKLVLENILPPGAFELQYRFANGEAVDAVVKAKEGLIPIDAKFSLDNYNRYVSEDNPEQRAKLEKDFHADLKKRIEETAKYIQPKEGTLPFAFMFIPAEGIYYDLLTHSVGAGGVNERSLIDYAYRDKNVIIVSPTTFAAYLQSVLYGFRAFQIEESAKEIGKRVEDLGRHLKKYEDSFVKVGSSLNTTVNHYSAAQKELGKIDKDVYRITGEKQEFEQVLMEKVG
jgi:DNA recombination protein RmuC